MTDSAPSPGLEARASWLELLASRGRSVVPEPDAEGRAVGLTWDTGTTREYLSVPLDLHLWPAARAADHVEALLRARVAERTLSRHIEEQRDVTERLTHDFNNPLAVIHANLEYLRGVPMDDPEAAETLEDAEDAVARIRSLVDDVRLTDLLEHDPPPLRTEPVRVSSVVSSAASLCERLGGRRALTVETACPVELEVRTHGALLTGLVHRLAEGRARRVARGGRVGVFVEVVGDRLHLRVADDGRPVTDPGRDRVFDKCGPGRNRSRELGNVGLRLHLCRLIAEALGGHIRLSEEPSWPTVFVVDLPLVLP
jgi:K+-sensing histidine kinase KdpD